MTLRKYMSEKRSTDELGSLIQSALQARVAGASPPPGVWERIRVRAEQSTVRGLALPPRGLHCEGALVAGVAVSGVEGRVGPDRGGYRVAMNQLSRRLLSSLFKVNAFLSAQTVRARHQNVWKEWRFDPDFAHTRLLVDQYGFRWLLAF